MTSGDDRWRRANDLFHLALDRPELQREAFLEQAAGADPALLSEVRSLLKAHKTAGDFLEPSAMYTSQVDSADRMVARQVGQYRIERVLGRGGMGVVYLAEDTRLGRRVALKAISPDVTHDMARRERLRREARAAAALAHHGIATIYALEEFGDDVFIAAEYVAGETLRQEVSRGAAPPARVLETAIGLTAALAAAHDAGIIHRDLKPENVIRTPAGTVKILDFGLAQIRDSSESVRLTVEGTAIGTPAYMAPEQIRREVCDARTDLFSLGIVICEMLTGRNPFIGSDAASTIARILQTEPVLVAPAEGQPDRRLSDELMAIVRTCLAKSPDGRFSSAHALLAALEVVRTGGSWRRREAASPDAVIRWWQFHQVATCVTYAALMLPLWWARGWIGRPGLLIFLGGLVATVAASILRLNLLFAASSFPDEWRAQRDSSHPFLRVSEFGLVAVLTVAGLWVIEPHTAVGAILVTSAVAILLSFLLIEPATTRAAFRRS